jgi:hypothetical protein
MWRVHNEGIARVNSKALIGAAGLAVAMSATCVAAPAFGAGVVGAPMASHAQIATTTTVTSLTPSITTSRAVTIVAQVSPALVGTTKISGKVSWVITGAHGKHVACTKIVRLHNSGMAKCKIVKDVLRAYQSPFRVTATFSGDANFASSSGFVFQRVIRRSTALQLVIPVRPTSGAQTVAQAIVKAGGSGSKLLGNITFVIHSGLSQPGISANCEGSGSSAKANDMIPIVNSMATCTLPAGWFVVPAPTAGHSHSQTNWSITATYGGKSSFAPSTATHRGSSSV